MVKAAIYRIMKYLRRIARKAFSRCALLFIRLFGSYSDTTAMAEDAAVGLLREAYQPVRRYQKAEQTFLNDMDESVQISIVIPVYNSEAYLSACLDSILRQNGDYRYEIICVNDGSTDGSAEILKRYSQHACVKVIEQKNQGISGARNRGLEESVGQYVMFIDNDDLLDPDFLDTMMRSAASSGADIVKCGYQILRNGKLGRKYIEGPDCVLEDADISRIFRYNGFCWGTLYRRGFLAGFHFPVGYWYEDMITRVYLYPRCKVFSYVGQALYQYRMHQSNASNVVWKKANPKALDQYFLARDAFEMLLEDGISFNSGMCLAFQYELGAMLCQRTAQLDENLRKAVFSLACGMNDELLNRCPAYGSSGDFVEKMLNKAFRSRDYSMWNTICGYAAYRN